MQTVPTSFHIERYQTKKGRRFRAVVYVGKREGGPRRDTGRWRQYEREAIQDGRDMLDAFGAPRRTEETLAELLERWLRDYAAGATESTTLAGYKRIVEDHIVGVVIRSDGSPVPMGDVRARDLTAADFAEWQAVQLKTQKPKTVRNNRVPLGSCLTWATELGDLAGNELAKVPRPKLRRQPVEPPPVAVVQAHLTALEGTRYWRPALIAAATGLRRGEVLGLEWRHLDTANGVVMVRQNVRQVGAKVETVPYLKTDAGRRDLPLPEFAADLLRIEHAKDRLQGKGRPHDRVCGQIPPDSFTGGLRAMWDRKGLPRIRLHMLRHALASSMLAAGVPMLTVQAFLGHRDITTTMGTYGHLLPGALGDAAEVMGAVWQTAKDKAEGEAADASSDGVVLALRRRSALDEH